MATTWWVGQVDVDEVIVLSLLSFGSGGGGGVEAEPSGDRGRHSAPVDTSQLHAYMLAHAQYNGMVVRESRQSGNSPCYRGTHKGRETARATAADRTGASTVALVDCEGALARRPTLDGSQGTVGEVSVVGVGLQRQSRRGGGVVESEPGWEWRLGSCPGWPEGLAQRAGRGSCTAGAAETEGTRVGD